MTRRVLSTFCASLVALLGFSAVQAATIDGTGIPGEGLTLRATQDTPTGFGNALGGGQDSAGGSELNELYADIDGGKLKVGITGNLEGNFNKLFVFFDAVAGGENPLAADNADGGFGEINNLAGLMFDGGATMDHGIRFEVGGGFLAARFMDLIDNTASDIQIGGGSGDLPLSNAGTSAIQLGWDNSNVLGVDDSSAAGANTATTGIELEIDLLQAFGATQGDIGITAIVTNDNGGFLSNQALPGIGGGGNIGSGNGQTLPVAVVPGAPVPEPTTVALCGLVGLALAARRR